MAEPVVEVRNLRKDFGTGAVLDGVEFTVEENETTLLMGPNGCGKSVLLSCVAGGLFPDDGEVSIFGEPPTAARERLNFMLQGSMAIPELTGRENVAFYTGLHPRATDSWRSIVERVGLDDDLDREVRDYSEGMTRKLELALTLSVDVPLYLLDEPTVDLDLTTVDRIHSLLNERSGDGGTILLTSHAPRDVGLADRVLFMSRGEIVAGGAPGTLRDGVPTVVSVDRIEASRRLSEHVLGGTFFEREDSLRGFLPPDVDRAAVEEAADGAASFVAEPSHADVFNYYTQVEPAGADA